MRSSKQRSRGKSNRNRNSNGNNVNRVFDSSGPEGKVRGTPQQIIDKYQALTRDAQLANDRVAEENFQQHAEHYIRLLGDAMREQEARRAEQEAQHRERQAQREARQKEQREQRQDVADAPQPDVVQTGPADVIDPSDAPQPDLPSFITDAPAGIVETPEASDKPARKPRRRKPVAEEGEAGVVVEEAKPKPRRRAPKKAPEGETPDSPEAAE